MAKHMKEGQKNGGTGGAKNLKMLMAKSLGAHIEKFGSRKGTNLNLIGKEGPKKSHDMNWFSKGMKPNRNKSVSSFKQLGGKHDN